MTSLLYRGSASKMLPFLALAALATSSAADAQKEKPVSGIQIQAYADALADDSVTELYFYWDTDAYGNWQLIEAAPPRDAKPETPDITVAYQKYYGDSSSGLKTYLVWNYADLKGDLGLQRRMLESKVVSGKNNPSDNFVPGEDYHSFIVYGVSDTDGKQSLIDQTQKLYYNWEISSDDNQLLNKVQKDENGNISGSFIRNHDSKSYSYNAIEKVASDGTTKYKTINGGAVIFNPEGTLGNISGTFLGNYVRGTAYPTSSDSQKTYVEVALRGAVIYNGYQATIGHIDGTFIGNYGEQVHTREDSVKAVVPHGGVIYNHRKATIQKITGTFIGNFVYAEHRLDDVISGVIVNHGEITEGVHGTFIGNYAYAGNTANSGVLRNYSAYDYLATIGTSDGIEFNGQIYDDVSISGTFIGNYARGQNGDAFGGIMRNNGEIQGKILGLYIGNHAVTEGSPTLEVAAYDYTPGEGNYKYVVSDEGEGKYEKCGAGETGDYTQKMQKHSGTNTGMAQGGAYYNTIKADQGTTHVSLSGIIADFKDNYVQSKWGEAFGGAIYNQNAEIQDIDGSFVGNYAVSLAHEARGGAIYNNWEHDPQTNDSVSRIQNIGSESNLVQFEGNYAKGRIAEGGAIYVSQNAEVSDIYAVFTGNYAKSELKIDQADEATYKENYKFNSTDEEFSARGGAIYVANKGRIGDINADFHQNYVEGDGPVRGGALFVSYGVIGKINGVFSENEARGTDPTNTFGGAMRFDGATIDQLTATFLNNKTTGSGGALSLTESGYIIEISGLFDGNSSGIKGGAVHNEGTIGELGYIASTTDGEALKSDYSNATRNADNNHLVLINDETSAYNEQKRHEYDGSFTGGFVNASFINNTINAIDYNNGNIGYGGAIYTDKDLFITANDGQESVFANNIVHYKANGEVIELQSAIYVDNQNPRTDDDGSPIPITIYLVAKENATIRFEDRIRGVEDSDSDRFVLRLRGYTNRADIGAGIPDATGTIILNNLVMESYTIMDDVTLQLGSPKLLPTDKETLPTDYDPTAAGSNAPQYADKSYVMEQSHFSVRSGLVDMTADKGALTEYFFGSMIAYGKGFNYYENGSRNEGVEELYTGKNEHYATFAVDIELDKDPKSGTTNAGWSDIITVYEDAANDRHSKGRITLSALAIKSVNDVLYSGKAGDIQNEYAFKIQVLNLMVKGEDGRWWTEQDFRDNKYILTQEERANGVEAKAPIQLDDFFKHIVWEKSIMDSDEILASDIQLDSTKTHNDSIWLVGWRDNLAAWAEMNDTLPDDHMWEWVGDTDPVHNRTKVFTLVAGDPTHYLTRHIDYTNQDKTNVGADNPIMWGDDLTIVGEIGPGHNKLDLQEHNLLSQIGDTDQNANQKVQLRNFALLHVMNDTMLNHGKLTLDTMKMEDSLVVNNQHALTLQGHMTINHTITTEATTNRAATQTEMVIDDQTEVYKKVDSQKTALNIEGIIEHQNITHKGSDLGKSGNVKKGSGLTSQSLANDNFTTITNLVSTVNGQATEAFNGFYNNSLVMEGGKFNLFDLGSEVLWLRELHMKDGLVYVNSSLVNLNEEKMGGLRGEVEGVDHASYTGGVIWLNSLTITKDSPYLVTHVKFVTSDAGSAVRDNNIRDHKAWGPIFEYMVTYNDETQINQRGEAGRNGYYTFVRTGNLNPGVLAGEVNEQASLANTMLINEYAFEHANLYSDALYQARQQELYERSYAVVTPMKGKDYTAAASTGCPNLVRGYSTTGSRRAMWVRPYASFENVPLRNGPKVDMNLYGALVGADSSVSEYQSGWMSVFTGYLGYIGSNQKWATGNRTRTNGGLIGATETLYKGNFYTALTVSASISSGNTSTMFGSEDFTALTAGIASRSGYTFALDDCHKYVLQPSLQLSYTYVLMSDYTNGAGVRMESDPLQAFQIHPFVKFIIHEEDDWKPYLVGGFVWNLGGKSQFRADGERLPEMSIRPYAEYGVGVQKVWKDRYTFYGQLTGRNGGRQGFEISTGVRWNW